MLADRRSNLKRLFTALWLLAYATAGLLVHSHWGHIHGHEHASSSGENHSHAHSHGEGEHSCHAGHDHSSHPHGPHPASNTSKLPESASTEHHQHPPGHDEDCAGCKLLGSVSTPGIMVMLSECGWLISSAPQYQSSLLPVETTGLHLARAPPVL